MRRINENELEKLSEFMIEQFWGKEEMQQMFKGFNKEKGKSIATNILYMELLYFYNKGDIYIFDDDITGSIVGIQAKNLFSIQRILMALKSNKILKSLSKEEKEQLQNNIKPIKEVHSSNWYKKYCKNPYYILQFAIAKDMRGKGIARKMLEELFDYASKTNSCIVLETFTESNVPMYEHFGFKVKEFFETGNKELKEYRMLKKLNNKKTKNIAFGKLTEEDIKNVESDLNQIQKDIDNIFKN